ncbi:hypothetical protein ACQR16_01605 [Bradyrhizobium oligotrophicum]|uniref:hypothetical protein n=1 Tax=Bradyrhizobium oligotrophicum TaxID=44255 RepID=UPI003EBBC989
MMMILRSATLLAAALTLANCCMSGTGCSGPVASANAPAASPAMAATPTAIGAQQTTAAADWDGRVTSSEPDTDMAMEPEIGAAPRKGGKRKGDARVDVMSSQSSSSYRGRMSWEDEQAADLADEARLKQKLTICRNCSVTQ